MITQTSNAQIQIYLNLNRAMIKYCTAVVVLLYIAISHIDARPGQRSGHRGHHRHRANKPYYEALFSTLTCTSDTDETGNPCEFPELFECVSKPNHFRKESHESKGESFREWWQRRFRGQQNKKDSDQENTICLPKLCDVKVANSCPEGSQCLVPHRHGRRDQRPARCQVSCDHKLYLHSCLVVDRFGDEVRRSECRRKGATCSQERSEVIKIDGESFIAHFCEEDKGEIEESSEINILEKTESGEQTELRSIFCPNPERTRRFGHLDEDQKRYARERFQMYN